MPKTDWFYCRNSSSTYRYSLTSEPPLKPPLQKTTKLSPPISVTTGRPIFDSSIEEPEDPHTVELAKIGCEHSSDCQNDHSCINKLCVSICKWNLCGLNAECTIKEHTLRCKCPEGTVGNPNIKCSSIESDPPADIVEPIKEVLKAQTIPPLHPVASTPKLPDAIGISSELEVPEKYKPPVISVPFTSASLSSCRNNDDCEFDAFCTNNLCIQPCSLPVCGSRAKCSVHLHRPVCVCPIGTTGDPQIQCTSITVAEDVHYPPIGEDTPHVDKDIPVGVQQVTRPPPYIATTTLSLPETSKLPIVPSVPSGIIQSCELNSDCPSTKSCVNKKCSDICEIDYCGEFANCATLNNRPICVCPSGSTGNPTDKCKAISTEIEKPLSPIGDTPKIPVDGIIVPSKIKPEKYPAISEITTDIPPHYTLVYPEVPPIISSIIISCVSKTDCSSDTRCINNICVDVCSLGTCGVDSQCTVVEQRPKCLCPKGYFGDPQKSCQKILLELEDDSPSPISDGYELIDEDIIPHKFDVQKQPPFVDSTTDLPEEPVYIPIQPVYPSIIQISCSVDNSCPSTQTCVQRMCINICQSHFCGQNAQCLTINHKPECQCPHGTSGNPTIKCTALYVEHTEVYPPLSEYTETPIEQLIPTHKVPIKEKPLTFITTETYEEYSPPDLIVPIISSGLIACKSDSECADVMSCISNLCQNACGLGFCGYKSVCHAANHKMICICPSGTTGDPQKSCMSILGDTTPKISPAIQKTTITSFPIVPQTGEMPTTQPPLGRPATPAPLHELYDVPVDPGSIIPVVSACETTKTCPADSSCVNKLCVNLCLQDICGENAQCKTVNHRPTCSCPYKTLGNPTLKCKAIDYELEQKIPIESDVYEHIDMPIAPTSADRTTTHPASIFPTTTKSPVFQEPSVPPISSPVNIACKSNGNCDINNLCINYQCVDACDIGVCSKDAECSIQNHRPVCLCPSHARGNPIHGCQQVKATYPTTISPESEPQRPQDDPQILPSLEETLLHPPVSFTTERLTDIKPFIPSDPPKSPLISASCMINDECEDSQSCANQKCINMCHLGFCGAKAICEISKHRVLCTCPHGTVGNPTIKCTATLTGLLLETPRPISHITKETPIELEPPVKVPHSPLKPIILTTTTKVPPIITTPQSPPPIPPGKVACENHDDCESNGICINKICASPCYLGFCGENAKCQVHNRKPICLCPSGTVGHPNEKCISKTQIPHEPIKPGVEDIFQEPVDIVAGQYTTPTATPEKITSTTHKPPEFYPPHPPQIPAPSDKACKIESECPLDRSCLNSICVNICDGSFCGKHAECAVKAHRTICQCPAGTTGNPTIQCEAIEFDEIAELPPIRDKPVSPIDYPISPAQHVPEEHEAISDTPRPIIKDKPIPLPPPPPVIPAIIIACKTKDDCYEDNTCIKGLCYDVCELGTCSLDSECKAVQHRPVCVCPHGSEGSPNLGCINPIAKYPEIIPPLSEDIPGIDYPIKETMGPPHVPMHPLTSSTASPTEKDVSIPTSAPPVSLSSSACKKNDECDKQYQCINNNCISPCSPSLCGQAATCSVVDHRISCNCPHGTTGNPTTICSAVKYETITIQSPEKEFKLSTPSLIVAGEAESTSTQPIGKPPLYTKPIETISPTEPPGISAIIIACANNLNCPTDNNCIGGICIDVCAMQICGEGSICETGIHRAICTCPVGSTGVPTDRCIATKYESVTKLPPHSEMFDTSEQPHIPLSATTAAKIPLIDVTIATVALTTTTTTVDIPQYIIAHCISEDNCPSGSSCVNFICTDLCKHSLCGIDAKCITDGHRSQCFCPYGTTGNPTLKCTSLAITYIISYPPESEIQEHIDETVISGSNFTTRVPPAIYKEQKTTEKIMQVPKLPVTPVYPPIGCDNIDDCSDQQTCIHSLCYDTCSLRLCSEDAECRPHMHKPVCLCPLGSTGNPQTGCFAIEFDTVRPLDPVKESPIIASTKPIDPLSTVHKIPDPSSVTTVTAPDGEYITPSPVPTLPAIYIGCSLDDACSSKEKCYNNICIDPCVVFPCVESQLCIVDNHHKSCHRVVGIGHSPQCVLDTDCHTDQVCLRENCIKVCLVSSICAPTAYCRGELHKPTCYCPASYTGNPYAKCYRPEAPTSPSPMAPIIPKYECTVDSKCSPEQACIDYICKNPCRQGYLCGENANCIANFHIAMCICNKGYYGNAYVRCNLPTSTPPSVFLRPQCVHNTDCDYHEACFEAKCDSPCHILKPCGLEAVCDDLNHEAHCSCPLSFIGDPYVSCYLPPLDGPEPECRIHEDCIATKACNGQQCINPCASDACASNAKCIVKDHRPVCGCREGYTGDPGTLCIVVGCRDNSECPPREACMNRKCLDPCDLLECGKHALCRHVHQAAECYCPEPMKGDPYDECVYPECIVDKDCPSHLACVQEKCVDPCNCIDGAECQVINHRPRCFCPFGQTGDPNIKCFILEGKIEFECEVDGDCPSKMGCSNNDCRNLCGENSPCAREAHCEVINSLPYRTVTCRCPPGFQGNAYESCYQTQDKSSGCTVNDECGHTELCKNRICIDPCKLLNPCATNAECQVHNRKPQCTCPAGMKGDPQINCYTILVALPECERNEDCDTDKACYTNKCADPCIVEDPCGRQALCRVEMHIPICHCPVGWFGNPELQCFRAECTVDPDCPTDRACIDRKCVNPCTFDGNACGIGALCRAVLHREQCYCPPGLQGDPRTACISVGCRTNDDCALDKACDIRNGACLNVCHKSTCASEATCRAVNHASMCSCPIGYEGNPFISCVEPREPIPTPIIPESGCRSDDECPVGETCSNQQCADPCSVVDPCLASQNCRVTAGTKILRTVVCECPPDEILFKEGICVKPSAVVPECNRDEDCGDHEWCRDGTCKDVCRSGPCGQNAICTGSEHRPQCTCAHGFYGDPNDRCARFPPLVAPPTAECSSNDDCSIENICRNEQCINPCAHDEPCAKNAFCFFVSDHEPMCRCPQGFKGDPKIRCDPISPQPRIPCSHHSDCSLELACLQGTCYNPCNCGENAVCSVQRHRPICSCSPGYFGNPHDRCFTSSCRANADCPKNKMCHNGNCENPCSISNECTFPFKCTANNHKTECTCPSYIKANSSEACIVQGCKSNSDCPTHLGCRNNNCVNPCDNLKCGEGAYCIARRHSGICACNAGYSGIPTVKCSPPRELGPVACNIDSECTTGLSCINELCIDPCLDDGPCGRNAECSLKATTPLRTIVCNCREGYEGDAYTSCSPTTRNTCENNEDCLSSQSCIEGICKDPCNCAQNARCTVFNHRPICTCLSGFIGDPNIECVTTECTNNEDCPDEKQCFEDHCLNPCLVSNYCPKTSNCIPKSHKPICECRAGYGGDALIECKPTSCRRNSECPSEAACIHGKCRSPCVFNNECASNSRCQVKEHNIQCTCDAGYRGNGRISCNPVAKEVCRSDPDCQKGDVCYNRECFNPCLSKTTCPDPYSCSVSSTSPIRMIGCSCPDLMVTSKDNSCTNIEISISIGCRVDSECQHNQACINTQCVVPCNCGANADCTVVSHRPICTCIDGYQGDPKTGCYKAGCSRNEQCPTTMMCYNAVCVNPCLINDPCAVSAECYPELHTAKCRCPPGLEGNPLQQCFIVGCRSNAECPTNRACVNQQCIDPCIYDDACAHNAECFVYEHISGCRCPPEKPYGDPRVLCEEQSVIGVPPPVCKTDGNCPPQYACIDERCVNPCFHLKPCDISARCKVIDTLPVRTMLCICPDGEIVNENSICEKVPLVIEPDCRSDTDCPQKEACINHRCKDPCECGPNAECNVIDHRAICTCQVGYDGSPEVGCFSVGCTVDPDCADDKACYEGVCANPCFVDNPCSPSAECYAKEHIANCRCPSGLIGDGYSECLITGCRVDANCPPERACVNNKCLDPCELESPCSTSAECIPIEHQARCRCPPGTYGDPMVSCTPIPRQECYDDKDCSSQYACLDGECSNPCVAIDPCDETAICKVIDTLPVRTMTCVCPDGLIIGELKKCQAIPSIIASCAADDECPPKEACANGFCKDPCQCGANADCEIIHHRAVCSCKPGYEGDPDIRCIEIGCYGNKDCPTTHACKNGQCTPVCGPNNQPCGQDAICHGINHNPKCICPPGMKGNPTTLCISIGCISDDNCPNNMACVNEKCDDPCALDDPCKLPSECKVSDHSPTCPCPPGYKGTMENGCERIIIGCRTDSDCPELACINRQCQHICHFDPCGTNANCDMISTLPLRIATCICIPGYQGDAFEICDPVPVCPIEKGFTLNADGQCTCPFGDGFYVDENGNCKLCPTEKGFILTADGRCICDPERGYIYDDRTGECSCPIPLVRNANGNCILVEVPPVPPVCVQNSDCPQDRMCENNACDIPCAYDPCAKHATCLNANHTAHCICLTGYSGDPFETNGCRKVPILRTDFPRPPIEVNCLADGVQVVILVGTPGFNGVMYVKGYSKNEECRKVLQQDVDVGTIDFKVKFNTCGLIHEHGSASFVLVIQKHPKLVTYKAQASLIKCAYSTGEKTITIGFNVSMLTTAGTIANTGPPPRCLMKITNQNGGDISQAEIGDLLHLRIEVEPSDIYGGFARSCVALTADEEGENEYIVTDENGCAKDALIFQEWEIDSSKSLVAAFNAFRFPSSNSIRFQCNVRVCFGRCQPVNCNGYDAFGKRRRRQAVDTDSEYIYADEATLDGQMREIQVQSQAILTVERRSERLTAEEELYYAGPDEVCVSKWGFIIALIITALLALVAVAVAVSCWLMAYRRRPKFTGPLPHPENFPNPLFTTPEPLAEPSPDYFS